MAGRLPRLPGVVASVSTAGRGYFIGYSIFTVTGSVGTLVQVVDQVRVFSFILPFRAVVANIATEVTTAGGASTLYGVGLYDTNKNLLLHTGAVDANTTQVNNVAITARTLEPGHYWLAQTSDSATTQCRIINTPATEKTLMNAATVQVGTAANAASAGVLPATLGTITAAVNRLACTAVFAP